MSTAAGTYVEAQDDGAGLVPATSSGQPWPGADPMVAETVVEKVLQARKRGYPIAAVARAFALDRKTVRTWERRGVHLPRVVRPTVWRLDPYRDGLEKRASEVDHSASVLPGS